MWTWKIGRKSAPVHGLKSSYLCKYGSDAIPNGFRRSIFRITSSIPQGLWYSELRTPQYRHPNLLVRVVILYPEDPWEKRVQWLMVHGCPLAWDIRLNVRRKILHRVRVLTFPTFSHGDIRFSILVLCNARHVSREKELMSRLSDANLIVGGLSTVGV